MGCQNYKRFELVSFCILMMASSIESFSHGNKNSFYMKRIPKHATNKRGFKHLQMSIDSEPSVFDGMLSFREKFSQASSEGFGTKAKNVAKTMKLEDIVVPLCGNLEMRQVLANRGIYPGVEYEICSLKVKDVEFQSMGEVPNELKNDVVAMVRPAYKLRDYLERSDWPVPVNPSQDVPLWLSKTTYEAGTVLGTAMLSFSYLTMAAIIAFFVRFAYVPSASMTPTLNPGDVVLVTRTIWPFKPTVGDVILFDPPPNLSAVVSNSQFALENGAQLPSKGQQFLKRVVAREGEYVGVKNSEPIVDLTIDVNKDKEGASKKYRANIVGPYSQPSAFPDSSWNRPPEKLAKNQYFVTGDNGYRSVDSRVWGPLEGKHVLGSAKLIIWPIQHVGPIKSGQIFEIEK